MASAVTSQVPVGKGMTRPQAATMRTSARVVSFLATRGTGPSSQTESVEPPIPFAVYVTK